MEKMEITLESVGKKGLEGARYMLIGKIIADKILNQRGVMAILRGLWTEETVYSIRELGMNKYNVSFKLERLMTRAMEEGPWSIMGAV